MFSQTNQEISHQCNAFVKFKCLKTQIRKKTASALKAERIGVQFALCLRRSGTGPTYPPKICAYEWKRDRKRGRRSARQREREKASSLCSSASKKQLYYITVARLGSSHAFKEEAHVPLHLKSHGTVGEDRDGVEAWETRRNYRCQLRDGCPWFGGLKTGISQLL